MKKYKHPILWREANDLKINRLGDWYPYKIYAHDRYDQSDVLFYSEKEIVALWFEEVNEELEIPEWFKDFHKTMMPVQYDCLVKRDYENFLGQYPKQETIREIRKRVSAKDITFYTEEDERTMFQILDDVI